MYSPTRAPESEIVASIRRSSRQPIGLLTNRVRVRITGMGHLGQVGRHPCPTMSHPLVGNSNPGLPWEADIGVNPLATAALA